MCVGMYACTQTCMSGVINWFDRTNIIIRCRPITHTKIQVNQGNDRFSNYYS